MTQTKQYLHNMYVGFVFVNWSNDNTKLGTAKQKALTQMQSFAKTIDKNNLKVRDVNGQIDEMSRSVSKQIMTDKSSEMVLDKKLAPQYRSFGERQIAQSKKALTDILQRTQKRQDAMVKKDAMQYRALKTNVPAKAPKPIAEQKLDRDTMMRILMQRQMQNAA